MKRKNPSAPLRTGFDYQDFWGVKLCADWLIKPDKYQWIWFETSPSEDNQDRFFLDDIVLLDKENKYHLYQIKHKENPESDKWSWVDLLKQEKGKRKPHKDSLIQKWFKSFFKPDLRGKIGYAAFITNGFPERGIADFIKDNKIDVQKIKKDAPEVYTAIKSQLGAEEEIDEFFRDFTFSFGESGRIRFENEIRELFYNELRATKSGFNNLLLKIHSEASRQQTGPIILEAIKQWCEFDQPQHLNEQFAIPDDFEFFDGIEHKKIFHDLRNPSGGIKVIYGKPGTGKSTYLSKLHALLQENAIISIRHHYHISPSDTDPVIRLKAQRVTEALKAQFKEYPKELGNLSNKNSLNIQLFEYISALARNAKSRNRSFVLIIDGLDHVLRQGHEDELKSFLSDVCFPQPGLWIVIGMQEIAKQYLPQIIYEIASEDKWIEIKGLSPEAVDRIFNMNVIGLNLPDFIDSLTKLSEKLYQVSKGNPLHLRYSLQQLKNQLSDRVLTEFSFGFLRPYDENIVNYYDSLWRKLPGHSKTVAIIISCVDFQFKKSELLGVISTFITDPAEITESFKSISHLLSQKNQKLSVYHNSFRLFLIQQTEFKEQEITVKKIIRDWLEKSDNEDLKWAELKKLAYFLGDSEPILEINREWLVNAVFSLRTPGLITSQLNLGREAAYKAGRFGKVLEFAILDVYFENAQNFIEDAWKEIWELAFESGGHDHLDFNLTELTAEQVPIIVKEAVGQGDFSIIPEAIDRLNYLHRYLSITPKGEIGSGLPQLIVNTIKTVALDRKHEHQRLFRYVKRFRKSRWSEDLFSVYAEILLRNKQFEKLSNFLKSDFEQIELQEILKKCAEYDNMSRENRYLDIILSQRHESLHYFNILYLVLRKQKISPIPSLPPYEIFPDKVPEYESGKREERAQLFSANFILGLIYALQGKDSEIQEWIDEADDRWPLNIMSQLFIEAMRLAGSIKGNQPISAKSIFDSLNDITPLEWPENRDLYELQICLKISISSIFKIILNIKEFCGDTVSLEEDEVKSILECKYYNRNHLLNFLLIYNRPLLAQNAYEQFMSQEQDIWEKHVVGFPDRSKHYADLAQLAKIHKDMRKRDEFLWLAADNLLGYGYHKDLFLDMVLEAIEACHLNGSKKAVEWIKKLAAAIENVTEYTDGDETNYIQKHLAEMLANIDTQELYKYYYQNAGDENLILAEDIFLYVIKSLKFDNEVDSGLATTALDQGSFETLVSMSSGNQNAVKSIKVIQDYFGEIEYKNDRSDSDEHVTNKKSVEYSEIKPEQLKEHLSSFKTIYDRNQYMVNWLRQWLPSEGFRIDVIYDTCISIIEEEGLHRTDGEVLDLLFPIAFGIDKKKAFELLCWAQANYHGWDRYYTDERKAEKRWKFVSENYNERYMEFFEKSILYSGRQFGRGGNYFMPIPRSIDFFALFNNLEIMEEITESAVSIIGSLMSNLQLPESKWLNAQQVDQFDVLLQRLTWPSPLVRERAACAIAELFNNDSEKEKLFDRFLKWLGTQKLESLIAVGLLPIIKALEKADGLYTYIDVEKLSNSIPITSVVIDKLVEEITFLLTQEIHIKARRRQELIPPEKYNPHKFFTKHINGFLAPVYSDHSETITSDTGLDFFRYWAYNSQEIAKEVKVQEQVGDAMNFMGYRPPIMAGMSTLLSEVYRSAFIRTLQYFYESNLLNIDFYHKYAFATLPIELSFWKLKSNRVPDWWPQLKHETPKESYQKEIVRFSFPNEDIENILFKKGTSTILGINGAIEPKNGWAEGVLDTSINVVGFAYKVTGPKIPDAEIVAKSVLYGPFIFTIPRMVSRPFNILECSSKFLPSNSRPIVIDNLEIYPLIARVMSFPINLWQWFRGYHPLMLLFKPASRETELRLKDERICYYSNEKLIAWSQDWTQGIREKTDLEIPHGTYIEIDKEYLNEYLNSKGLRLGYIMKTSHKFRKYNTEQEQTIEDYKLIGVSKIII